MKPNQLFLFIILIHPILYIIIWVSTGHKPLTWDAGWYRSIAEYGYQFNGDISTQNNTAFLPGFPITIYLTSILTGLDLVYAQLATSLFLYVAGTFFLFSYIKQKLDETSGYIFVITLSSNPFIIYFMNGYSESLFYALTGLFFFLYERKLLLPSALTISLASITRPHGAVLIILFFALTLYSHYKTLKREDKTIFYRFFIAAIHSARYLPAIFLAPTLLTIFYYLKFNDSAVYLNSLYAWTPHAATLTIMELFKSLFLIFSITPSTINILEFKYIPPDRVALIIITIQTLSLITVLATGLRTKLKELIIFSLFVWIFCILNASYPNLGRHFIMVLSTPILMTLIYQNLINNKPDHNPNGATTRTKKTALIILLATTISFGLLYFILFSIKQINGTWIS